MRALGQISKTKEEKKALITELMRSHADGNRAGQRQKRRSNIQNEKGLMRAPKLKKTNEALMIAVERTEKKTKWLMRVG